MKYNSLKIKLNKACIAVFVDGECFDVFFN